jgi:hypothetical protein
MNDLISKMNSAWWTMRIGLGSAAFLAGLDKFFNLLADWKIYLSPIAVRMLPVSDVIFMHAVGVIEMIVGLAILSRWTRTGFYVAMVWLFAIALNLLTTGRFIDIAVRDIVMAITAFTLARLTSVREAGPAFAAKRVDDLPGAQDLKVRA